MKKEQDQEKQKQEEKHEKKFSGRMEEELAIEKKLEIQQNIYEMRGETVREERYKNVKLPKLIITKFEGTHIDWFRFWNQYEFEIDRSQLHL